ncbi:hypothetical protein JCM11251_004962 [Rhodosporidiobolus azoricus]
MASPFLLSASRAARRCVVNSTTVVDESALGSSGQLSSAVRWQTTGAPVEIGEPSTSKRPLNSAALSRRRPTPTERTTPPNPQTPPRKPSPTPRKRRFQPPVLEPEPSAVSLLSQIRQSAPTPPAGMKQSQSSSAHNLAVMSITRGTRHRFELSYQHAFQQGWTPLRRSGQVGRVPAEMVGRVLLAVMKEVRQNPERAKVDWKKTKELILWLCGEPEKVRSVVADWAWEAVASGPAGCERVVEIFEAVRRDEHKALREGPKSPDYDSKEANPFTIGKSKEPKMTTWLFSARIAASAILRSQQPSTPSFASLLPEYLDPSFPRLEPLFASASFSRHLEKHFLARKAYEDPIGIHDLLLSSIRQVSLAQQWYSHPGAPAIGVWTTISRHFRAGEFVKAWALWQTVQQAVDSEEMGWISVDEWDRSATERWLSKEFKDELERKEQSGSAAEEDVVPAASPSSLNETPSNDSTARTRSSHTLDASHRDEHPSSGASSLAIAPHLPPSLPAATLHQALVAKFLSGFALSHHFDYAQSIWSWLNTRKPPLSPGVVCWTGLLNGYARRGDVTAVEQVFADMRAAQVEPDLWAWLDRITAHFEAKAADEAIKLVGEMKRDPAVVRHLAKEFDAKLPEAAYNSLIAGLLSNNRKVEAEAMLDEMDQASTPPSTYTLNSFVKLYTRGSKPDLPATARLIEMVSARGLEVNVFTFTMVLMALVRAGHKDAANKTVSIMEASKVKPTIVTYGALLASLAQTGEVAQLKAAVQLLDDMESKRMATNEIHYTSVIQGFLNAADTPAPAPVKGASAALPQQTNLEAALTLKQRMEKRGLALNRVGYNALLSYALALKSPEGVQLALNLLREMNQSLATSLTSPSLPSSASADESTSIPLPSTDSRGRNVTVGDTWYILLQGFTRMHDWARAHAVVMEMRRSGFEVRNKGLAKLVKYVTRREYSQTGMFG